MIIILRKRSPKIQLKPINPIRPHRIIRIALLLLVHDDKPLVVHIPEVTAEMKAEDGVVVPDVLADLLGLLVGEVVEGEVEVHDGGV